MEHKEKWRKIRRGILSAVPVLLGVCLVLYPFVSDYVYEHRTDSLVQSYREEMDRGRSEALEQQWKDAREYNEELARKPVTIIDPFGEASEKERDSGDCYELLLNRSEDGLMGFLEIPVINVYLPIYHGTDASVLERGAGHLKGTSLPVGGENTHAVISGHTGLNGAKLFTDLENVREKDIILLHILGEELAYRVISVKVVEPDDTSDLTIREGEDLVTLVTCTPYGVNSHRLLVTAERTEVPRETTQLAGETSRRADSQWRQKYGKALLAGVLAGLGLVCCLIFLRLIKRMVRKHREIRKQGNKNSQRE